MNRLLESISAQRAAANCRTQRAQTVSAAIERRPTHGRTSVLSALPPPRHGKSAAADLVALRRALDTSILSIEGAWTHAHGIRSGAVAVFVRFRAQPGRRRARRGSFAATRRRGAVPCLSGFACDHFHVCLYTYFFASRPIFRRRLAQWFDRDWFLRRGRRQGPGSNPAGASVRSLSS